MPFDPVPAEPLSISVYRDRLLGLCRVLDGVDDGAFDLRDWQRNGSCDSVACAVGWAMRDDWFRGEGLGRVGRSPSFGGLRGWKAVRNFFGLSREEAFYLFHAGRYENPTRKAVVTRIREFASTR